MNTDKTVISRKFPCTKRGFKYFAGYKNNEEVAGSCVLLAKWVTKKSLTNFDSAKIMSFWSNVIGKIQKSMEGN